MAWGVCSRGAVADNVPASNKRRLGTPRPGRHCLGRPSRFAMICIATALTAALACRPSGEHHTRHAAGGGRGPRGKPGWRGRQDGPGRDDAALAAPGWPAGRGPPAQRVCTSAAAARVCAPGACRVPGACCLVHCRRTTRSPGCMPSIAPSCPKHRAPAPPPPLPHTHTHTNTHAQPGRAGRAAARGRRGAPAARRAGWRCSAG